MWYYNDLAFFQTPVMEPQLRLLDLVPFIGDMPDSGDFGHVLRRLTFGR